MDELLRAQIEEIYTVFPERPPMLTIRQVADYLHKDYRSLLNQGKFPVKRNGGRWEVSVVKLAGWMLR